MRIIAIVQGEFGRRKVRNIRAHSPKDWDVESWEVPTDLPLVLDDLEAYLPGELPESDLVLALGESPPAMQMVPEVIKKVKAKAVIVPIDDRGWLPPGLEEQLKREFDSLGIFHAFPSPFCALANSKDKWISNFCRFFGKPKMAVDVENGVIKEARVIRDAPCGNTRYVAGKLAGVDAQKATMLAQQYHHQHPCLASSIKDRYAHDNMMNRASRILEKEIKKRLL